MRWVGCGGLLPRAGPPCDACAGVRRAFQIASRCDQRYSVRMGVADVAYKCVRMVAANGAWVGRVRGVA